MTRAVACALVAVVALSGCGGADEPQFCRDYVDAQTSFPGKSTEQNALFFQTLADVAPPELAPHLRAMTTMVQRPKKFRRVAWDRHQKTVQGWLTSHCEG